MKVLGVSSEEQKALWLILGAIYHLGAAGATKGRKTNKIKIIQIVDSKAEKGER